MTLYPVPTPFETALGPFRVGGPGTFLLDIDARHCDAGGTMTAGALAAVADFAAFALLNAAADGAFDDRRARTGPTIVTADLSLRYLATPRVGDRLVISGAQRTIANARRRVVDFDLRCGTTIALRGSGLWALVTRPAGEDPDEPVAPPDEPPAADWTAFLGHRRHGERLELAPAAHLCNSLGIVHGGALIGLAATAAEIADGRPDVLLARFIASAAAGATISAEVPAPGHGTLVGAVSAGGATVLAYDAWRLPSSSAHSSTARAIAAG